MVENKAPLKFDIDASTELIPLVGDEINAGTDTPLTQDLSFSLVINHAVTQLRNRKYIISVFHQVHKPNRHNYEQLGLPDISPAITGLVVCNS